MWICRLPTGGMGMIWLPVLMLVLTLRNRMGVGTWFRKFIMVCRRIRVMVTWRRRVMRLILLDMYGGCGGGMTLYCVLDVTSEWDRWYSSFWTDFG